jgi:hypothetical protein
MCSLIGAALVAAADRRTDNPVWSYELPMAGIVSDADDLALLETPVECITINQSRKVFDAPLRTSLGQL